MNSNSLYKTWYFTSRKTEILDIVHINQTVHDSLPKLNLFRIYSDVLITNI